MTKPIGKHESASVRVCIEAVLALAIIFSLFNGTVDSEAVHAGDLKPRPWTFQFVGSKKTLRLAVRTGYCVNDTPPYIEKVRVRERAHTIILTTLVRYPPSTSTAEACAGVGIGLFRTVVLDRPVGRGVALYDGSISPPKKRWPLRKG
jgi:hypothetical protein